jgi:hypothetical protein
MMVFSIAGGIAVPCAVGVIGFGDSLSLPKFLSLLVVFLAVFLVTYRKGEALSRGKLFLLFCAGLALCNGAYGALLDIQQRITGVAEREEMVALTYLVATLLSLVQLALRERKGTLAAFRQTDLGINRITAILHPDSQGSNQKQRAQKDQGHCGHHDIKNPLANLITGFRRRRCKLLLPLIHYGLHIIPTL